MYPIQCVQSSQGSSTHSDSHFNWSSLSTCYLMVNNGIDIYNEYKDQLDLELNPTQIAALSNMLGRQGTREYIGNVLRDGKTLAEVFPHLYGADKKQANKTPDEYIKLFTQ